jgi:hypothetical protein
MKNTLYLCTALLVLATSAHAEVKTKADNGFSVFHSADIDATPDIIWKRLISPKDYWNKEHSWSGSVAGFTLDPRPGGCFCEAIQEELPGGKFKTLGNVEHMRVIYAQPGKVLRMQGALGPLQSEAMLGTLTVAIAPAKSGNGSTVSFSYVAGGYMRYKPADIATAVDKVIGEQFAGLIKPYIAVSASAAVETKSAEWSLDVDKVTSQEPASSVEGALNDMKLPTQEEAEKPLAPAKPKLAPKPIAKAKPGQSESR